MSLLRRPGELAEVPLAAILLEALHERATGVLTIEHAGAISRVYLCEGLTIAAQSSSAFLPLGRALLDAGLIDMAALTGSLEELARTGRPQGLILVEQGAVTARQVEEALAEQQERYLMHVVALARGTFRFDGALPLPAWTAELRAPPLRAIVLALETPQALSLVVAALQPVAGDAVGLTARYVEASTSFGWSPAEAALVARMQDGASLDALLAGPELAPERARAVVAALLLLDFAAARPRTSGSVATEPPLLLAPASSAPERPPPLPPPRPAAPPHPLRRSDPEEARLRRRRLLATGMRNTGVGPLAARASPPPGRPPGPELEPARPVPAAVPPSAPAPDDAELEARRAYAAAAPRARSEDFFERLGLDRSASREAAKAAYFKLAKTLHPDRFASPALADLAPGARELFAALNEAYEVLSDDLRRGEYLLRQGAEAKAGARASEELERAEACLRTGDLARARRHCEAALRADPRPEVQAALAWVLAADPRTSDRRRARELASAALKAGPNDRARAVLAQLARDEGGEDPLRGRREP